MGRVARSSGRIWGHVDFAVPPNCLDWRWPVYFWIIRTWGFREREREDVSIFSQQGTDIITPDNLA